ncbi:MAG: hypothetical protein RR177_00335 [Oscillospiraceae bacterium]
MFETPLIKDIRKCLSGALMVICSGLIFCAAGILLFATRALTMVFPLFLFPLSESLLLFFIFCGAKFGKKDLGHRTFYTLGFFKILELITVLTVYIFWGFHESFFKNHLFAWLLPVIIIMIYVLFSVCIFNIGASVKNNDIKIFGTLFSAVFLFILSVAFILSSAYSFYEARRCMTQSVVDSFLSVTDRFLIAGAAFLFSISCLLAAIVILKLRKSIKSHKQ